MQQYIGQIMLFGGNFAPSGWALCNGQLLAIQQNTALFSIIGTTYGGNGVSTFALPDLRGRVPLGWGTGIGLTPYVIGEPAGAEAVTLSITQMPMHNHAVNANAVPGTSPSPSNAMLAQTAVPRSSTTYDSYATGTPTSPVVLAPNTIGFQGNNLPHANVQPSLAMTFIIALVGIFPSRG